jgi:hypothetical protein
MKTVFSNSQVPHVWAQQTQPNGHSQSMRFEGDTLYSHSTPIGRIVEVRPPGLTDGGAGQETRVALLTSNTYSVTTSSKHMPAARNAVINLRVFYVPDVQADSEQAHAANLAYMLVCYAKEINRLRRKRDLWALAYESLEPIQQDARAYAQIFGLPEPTLNAQADAAAIVEFRAAWNARLDTPANVARRTKACEDRAAARERKAEREYAAQVARDVERLADFRAGLPLNTSAYMRDANGGAYLRISGDNVQTSLGAHVPVADARRVISLIRAYQSGKCPPPRDGAQYDVGAFHIDTLYTNGDIKAGCHYIQFAEIDAIGRALGV